MMWGDWRYAQAASTRNLIKLKFQQWQLNAYLWEPPSAPFHRTAQSSSSGLKAVQPGESTSRRGDIQSLGAGGIFVTGKPRWAIAPALASCRLALSGLAEISMQKFQYPTPHQEIIIKQTNQWPNANMLVSTLTLNAVVRRRINRVLWEMAVQVLNKTQPKQYSGICSKAVRGKNNTKSAEAGIVKELFCPSCLFVSIQVSFIYRVFKRQHLSFRLKTK